MKWIVLVLLTVNAAIAQHKEPEPKDDTIYIESGISGDSLFTMIGKQLVKNGFALRTTNREFGQITAEKTFADYNFSYSMNLVVDGNRIQIKPTVITSTILGTYRWYYLNQKSSKNYVVLEDILKSVGGIGSISYNKEG